MTIFRRDVLKIGGTATLFGAIKATFPPGVHAAPAEFGTSPPTGGIVSGSTRVTTAAAFQTALNHHTADITLDAAISAPSGGFVVPRLATGITIRGTAIALITGTGTGPCLTAGGGTGGKVTLDHIRCDGGWRKFKTAGSGTAIPFRFMSMDFLSLTNCVSCYSRDLGLIFNNTKQAILQNCTIFCSCTGAFSDDNVVDLLVQDCWMQHGGDDSIQWHQTRRISSACRNVLSFCATT